MQRRRFFDEKYREIESVVELCNSGARCHKKIASDFNVASFDYFCRQQRRKKNIESDALTFRIFKKFGATDLRTLTNLIANSQVAFY